LGNDKIPAWDIILLKGDLKSSQSYTYAGSSTAATGKSIRIPQLETKPVEYTTQIKIDYNNYTNLQIENMLEGSLTMYDGKYIDNTYLVVDEDYLLVGVSEINADFDNDNFEIEVFKVEDAGEVEELTPLMFLKNPVSIKDGILLDTPEGGVDHYHINSPKYTNTSYVEYWFDIFCDHEIEDDILCDNKTKTDARGNIFIQDTLYCPEKVSTTSLSQIGVTEEEEEEC
jgi:hypothetical protein